MNLKGSFLCCQAVIAIMRAQKYGRIINIGSILAKNGGNARPWLDRGEQAHASNVAYGVSKAGVHAMTLFLARELAGRWYYCQCGRARPGRISDDGEFSASACAT